MFWLLYRNVIKQLFISIYNFSQPRHPVQEWSSELPDTEYLSPDELYKRKNIPDTTVSNGPEYHVNFKMPVECEIKEPESEENSNNKSEKSPVDNETDQNIREIKAESGENFNFSEWNGEGWDYEGEGEYEYEGEYEEGLYDNEEEYYDEDEYEEGEYIDPEFKDIKDEPDDEDEGKYYISYVCRFRNPNSQHFLNLQGV